MTRLSPEARLVPSCSDELRLWPLRHFLNWQGGSHIWEISFSSSVLEGEGIPLASGVRLESARRMDREIECERGS